MQLILKIIHFGLDNKLSPDKLNTYWGFFLPYSTTCKAYYVIYLCLKCSAMKSNPIIYVEGHENDQFSGNEVPHAKWVLEQISVPTGDLWESGTGTNSIQVKDGSCDASGDESFAIGNSTTASSFQAVAEGLGTIASGFQAHAEGASTVADGNQSHAEGSYAEALGDYSHAQNNRTLASGRASHSGGLGVETKPILASGEASFNHSENTGAQTIGFGALADNSAILGGLNNNIINTAERSVVLGGNQQQAELPDTAYADYLNARIIQFTRDAGKALSVGDLTRNTSEFTLDYKASNNVNLQLNQEQVLPIMANGNLVEGRYVRFTGYDVATKTFIVSYSDNSNTTTAFIDGMLTENILDGERGLMAYGGKVRGLNTNGISANSWAYLGKTGLPTNVAPTYPDITIIGGRYGNSSATEGEIFVSVNSVNQKKFNEIDTALELRANQNTKICAMCPILPVDIVIDTTALTISVATVKGGQTISASNPIRVFTDGSGVIAKHEFSVAQTASFTNTTGRWYTYFAQNGTFTCTQTEWQDFNTIAPVFIFDWDATLSGSARLIEEQVEMHLNTISADDHTSMHFGTGTIHLFGGELVRNELTTGSPNADGRNTCVSLTSCTSMDDNYKYTTTNTTPNTPVNYFEQDLGHTTAGTLTSSNSGKFPIRINSAGGQRSFLPATRFPFKWNTSNNRPQYITSAGVATDVIDDRYFVYYLYQLQDRKVGQSIRLVSAETDFATPALAQAHQYETLQTLYPDLRNPENRVLYKLIFLVNHTVPSPFDAAVKYTRLHERVDLRKGKYISGGVTAGGTVLATNVTTTSKTIITSTNVESALQEVNDYLDTNILALGTGTEMDLSVSTKYDGFSKTMTANTTFTFANVKAGDIWYLELSGAFTPTFTNPSGFTIAPNVNNGTYTSGKTTYYWHAISSTKINMTMFVNS